MRTCPTPLLLAALLCAPTFGWAQGEGAPEVLAEEVRRGTWGLFRATDPGGDHVIAPYSLARLAVALDPGPLRDALRAEFGWSEGLPEDLGARLRDAERWLRPHVVSSGTPAQCALLNRRWAAPVEPADVRAWSLEESRGLLAVGAPGAEGGWTSGAALWGSWLTRPKSVRGAFVGADGVEREVECVRWERDGLCGSGDGWRAAECSYAPPGWSMLVLVPDDMASFSEDFDASGLASILGALTPHHMILTLPEFELESHCDVYSFAEDAPRSPGTRTRVDAPARSPHAARLEARFAGSFVDAPSRGSSRGEGLPEVELEVDRPFFVLVTAPGGLPVLFGRVTDPR